MGKRERCEMTKKLHDWMGQFDTLKLPQAAGALDEVDARKSFGRFEAVRFMRWQAMTSARPEKTTAAIMILNPDTLETELRYKHVLILRFWDHAKLDLIDSTIARLFGHRPDLCVDIRARLRRKSAWPWRPPLSADADQIVAFLASLPPEVTEVDVACEYGRSRSRAVAEWIAHESGIEATGNRTKGRPNPRLAFLLRGNRRGTGLASASRGASAEL